MKNAGLLSSYWVLAAKGGVVEEWLTPGLFCSAYTKPMINPVKAGK